MTNTSTLKTLNTSLSGELFFDDVHKNIYATDASVYRKIPLAVAFPKNIKDIQTLIEFATKKTITLIPRTAGTSLAGQCVGDGIVVDVSKHFTSILEFDEANKTIKVAPGIIRDDLNRFLKPYGLFFGPNTSTSNRCMIGGMVGNNSSGTTSIQYGVTRDKVLAMQCVLSDGSDAFFSSISIKEFEEKKDGDSLEAKIYSKLFEELSNPEIRNNIKSEFPKPSIHRRNTGYAVDELLKNNVFGDDNVDFNLCKLLSGSEGTLAFTTEVTLQLDEIPPQYAAMVATHYKNLEDCLSDVAPVMQHNLHLCEMMDKVILDCTKNNRAQLANRFFVEGDPAAILMLEVKADNSEKLEKEIERLQHQIAEEYGYELVEHNLVLYVKPKDEK